MKVCFLILAHKNIDHLIAYARQHLEYNFYVHFDKKTKIYNKLPLPNNFHILENRVDVNWGGFSMVQATLNLIEFSLQHDPNNEFFHLISGEDFIFDTNLQWFNSSIFIEMKPTIQLRYRNRLSAIHADKKYQRNLIGKFLTIFNRIIDKIIFTNKTYYFGSQWFSIRKSELTCLMNNISNEFLSNFRNKLCPDEFFFQTLILKSDLFDSVTNDNKRFIVFDKKHQRGNSPIFLNQDQILSVKSEGYWFARKVDSKTFTTLNG